MKTIALALFTLFVFGHSGIAQEQKWSILGTVSQVLDDGLLVEARSGGSGNKKPNGLVFLSGHPDQAALVEGDKIKCTATSAAPYRYTTVLGASKTIPGFSYLGKLY